MSSLISLYPKQIEERAYKTNANPTGGGHLDKLLGIKGSFELLKSGATLTTDVSRQWIEQIGPYLLYN
jgi:hypothetical protein